MTLARVLVFSAAFPFFNNVDESYHFDLVVKYSHLQIPKQQEYVSGESLQYMAVFSTWEYLYTNDSLQAPPWKQPLSEIEPILIAREKRWHLPNYESPEPPLYYLLSGGWWRLGLALGFHDVFLLYFVRFLNAILIASLIWLGWLAARLVFPQNLFVRMGVPAILAFMPQTAFYSISNDILSPVCFGLAFICLLSFWNTKVPSVRLAIAAGLALAATFLAKMTNLPLLAVSLGFILLNVSLVAKDGKLKSYLPSLAVLFICAVLPAAIWAVWCKCYYGSLTGSPAKIQALGWTIKPFMQWWHHPIFTPFGAWTYLSGQLDTFWQGEFLWHNQRLSLPGTGVLYAVVTIVLVMTATFGLFSRSSKDNLRQRQALQLSLACFVAVLGFFALSSIIYDFHDCFYPSRQHPYFTSGRLLLGALIPFLLLFVYGLDMLLSRFGSKTKFIALAVMISAMFVLEIVTDWSVFSSQYNWFHV